MAMSATDVKGNVCKSKLDETDSANKPCIDFQPCERLQIKDEQENVPNSNIDLNYSNGHQSRRLRSNKSSDSSVVNCEVTDCLFEDTIKTKNIKNQDAVVELVSSKTSHVNSNRKRLYSDNDIEDLNIISDKKRKVDNEQISLLDGDPNIKKCNDEEAVSISGETSPQESMSVNVDNDLNTSVEIIKDLNSLKENVCDIIQSEIDIKEVDESKEELKSEKNYADVEIVNINDDGKKSDDESDPEIQIINLEGSVKPSIIDFPDPSSSENVSMTAGYPYYNSLKEKLPDFMAGDYKPVKSLDTGTFLLVENPSLLVPLVIKVHSGSAKSTNEESSVTTAALEPPPNCLDSDMDDSGDKSESTNEESSVATAALEPPPNGLDSDMDDSGDGDSSEESSEEKENIKIKYEKEKGKQPIQGRKCLCERSAGSSKLTKTLFKGQSLELELTNCCNTQTFESEVNRHSVPRQSERLSGDTSAKQFVLSLLPIVDLIPESSSLNFKGDLLYLISKFI